MKNSLVKIGATCAFAVTGMSVFAAGEATIPTLNCDISAYISQGITSLSAVVAVAVGGYVAFLLIRKGLRWMGIATGGR